MIEIPVDVSASELEDLQLRFIEEGIERSRELLNGLDRRYEAAQFGLQMHVWAEGAEQFGFHKIKQLALQTDQLLEQVPFQKTPVRASLSELLYAFGDLRDSRNVAVPDHLAQALRGKGVALIGFPATQAYRACTALGRVNARPRLFTVLDNLHAASICECDLVVVRVGPETDAAKLRVAAEGPAAGKLLLAGERRHLMALPPAIQPLVAEYLVEKWEPEELLMRLALALSRKETSSPVAAREFPARATAEESPRATAGATVLIVDDAPIIRTLLATTLRNYGMQCETADNGLDALRLIRIGKPQVVVLDVNMPGLDGYTVLSAVRAEKLPTLVVLLTARQQEEDVLRGFQLGADDYLVKPVNPPELFARIKRLLLLTEKLAA